LGIERLAAFLRKHRRIALDMNVFMYQLDTNPRYLNLTDQIFSWLERPGSTAVTSTVTIMELLVHPYRALDEARADAFYGLLSSYPNLDWIAPSMEIADLAARIRALHRLASPDASRDRRGLQCDGYDY
jgi:hypothetical protein